MRQTVHRNFLAVIAVLSLVACTKAPIAVVDLPISKGDWIDYNRSLETIDARQTPAERAEFARALQELKFQALANHLAPGPDTASAIRDQIAGWTVRDVLVLGLTIKADRKHEEEKALLRSIRRNRRLRTKPGDTESATFLASVNENQDKQLAVLRAEIAALEHRLDTLSPKRERRSEVVTPDELDERPVAEKK
jgi:hypothetical protein